MLRNAALAALIFAVALPLCCQSAGRVLSKSTDNLQGKWLFKTDPYGSGERSGWQSASLNDASWRKVDVPSSWEAEGITDTRPGEPAKPKTGVQWTDYDGIGWYRLRFVVPSSWAGMELLLSIPSIDDMDKTFFNGKLIGQTGAETENPVLVHRKYMISPKLVKPGRENVLAIRVTDAGGPGGISGSPVFLLPVSFIKKGIKLPGANRPLASRFADPPADTRILKIIHSWPDEADAQNLLIYSLISSGFGGVVCNVSFNDYLTSEERWKDFVRAVGSAKKSGMSMWLYDEKGYPSGTAGGLTMRRNPEWEVRGLLVNDAVVNGGQISVYVPSGILIYSCAYPEANGQIDIEKPVELKQYIHNGVLNWNAPEGRYRIVLISEDRLFDNTFNAYSLGDKLPYINLLMPEPTKRFIEVTHQTYADRLGSDLGKWFTATFTDEPSLMNRFVSGSKVRGLPWSPNLPAEFMKRRGYDITKVLPLLVAESGSKGKKVRYDFWKTVGELVSENYFGQIQQFCRDHGFASGGHLIQEEPILEHVACYGNFFSCIRRLDAPSIDCLTSNPAEVPWQIARLISSAAELEGNKVTMCETSDFGQTYRPEGDSRPVQNMTEAEIRGTCNRLLLGGITTITSYYTFNGITNEQLLRLNKWVGRCSTMLKDGHRAADIAVLYPTESIWQYFIPARNGTTDVSSAERISQLYDATAAVLYASNREFMYVDRKGLDDSKADKASLVHDKLRWRVLILPGVDTLPADTWEKIEKFYLSGGAVVALGSLPANSETDFPSETVMKLSARMFGEGTGMTVNTNGSRGVAVYIPKGSESMMSVILDSILEKDVVLSSPQTPIRTTHRRTGGHDVYFAINDSNSPWTGKISFPAIGSGEMWDPSTGKMKTIPGGSNIDLKLDKYGAVIFRFKSVKAPRRLAPDVGNMPSVELSPIPVVTPVAAGGEFVKTEISPDPEHNLPNVPAWRTSAKILKSNVDTYSMLTFAYQNPLDWSKAEYVNIETWMQEREGPAPRLLVFVRDKYGAEYYVEAGIGLSSKGYNQSTIPVGIFQPTPWATMKKVIDWKNITNVVIGWGGYFGTEGESLEYTLALPKIGRLK